MRRGSGRILVLLGLILALIAGFGVYWLLATATPSAAEVKTTDVIMAVQGITAHSEVSPDQIQTAPWPETIPTPAGAFALPTEVAGQLAMVPINPGQPITKDMLISKGDLQASHSNAALILEKGNVGIAMAVGDTTNVAQAIQAGDRVDILATFTAQPVAGAQQTGPEQTASQRLLADVLVLQVGQWPGPQAKSGNAPGPYSMVTFQLKEQDALVLKYAIERSNGLTLSLRSANDHELWTLEPVTLEYINKRFGFKFGTTGQ